MSQNRPSLYSSQSLTPFMSVCTVARPLPPFMMVSSQPLTPIHDGKVALQRQTVARWQVNGTLRNAPSVAQWVVLLTIPTLAHQCLWRGGNKGCSVYTEFCLRRLYTEFCLQSLHRVLFTQSLHRVLFTQSLHRVLFTQSSCRFGEMKVMDSNLFEGPLCFSSSRPNDIFFKSTTTNHYC